MHLVQELENLRDSLEESESTTAAQQEIRAQRENELAQFKKTLEEETANHEATVTAMRQKYSKAIEDLNEQLEAARKVCILGWVVWLACKYILKCEGQIEESGGVGRRMEERGRE